MTPVSDPGLAYKVVHVVHFVSVAAWLAGAATSDAHLTHVGQADDLDVRRRAFTRARRATLGIEMPASFLVLALGLILLGMDFRTLLPQGWLHAKLACVVCLFVTFSLATIQQRKLGESIELGDTIGQRAAMRKIRVFRTLTALFGLLILVCVAWRFGVSG